MSDIEQAGRPSAMKPFSRTSHTVQEQRPRGRAGSNSSASSATSAASTKSHDQFVFSPHQTPASEKEPFFSHQEFSSLNHSRTHRKCKTVFLGSLVRIIMIQTSGLIRRMSTSTRRRCFGALLCSIAATAITSAVTVMASEWVAPKTIGSYWLLRTTVKRWNYVQPSSWCMVVARRVWHRQALASFTLSRCGRTRATGTTLRIITTPIQSGSWIYAGHVFVTIQRRFRVVPSWTPQAISGHRERAPFPPRVVAGGWSRTAPVAGQGIVDFCGKGVSNNGHCIAAHAVQPASVLQDVITQQSPPSNAHIHAIR